MRKLKIVFTLLFVLSGIHYSLFAEQEKNRSCVALKLENERLKREIAFLTDKFKDQLGESTIQVINSFNEEINFSVESCEGNKTTKKVLITFKCVSTSGLAPQYMRFFITKTHSGVVDYNDTFYRISSCTLDGKKNSGTLFSKNKVLLATAGSFIGQIEIDNVDSNTISGFKVLTLYFKSRDKEGDSKSKGPIEFSGINIDWK